MAVLDFSHRSSAGELMDTETVPFDDFRACLRDLARVNRLTFAYRPTLQFLDRLLAAAPPPSGGTLEVVDVGSGYGDALRAIASWARRRRVRVALTGVDLNPWAARAAAEASAGEPSIRWVTADAMAYEPAGGVDVIISSLFTHHLPDDRIPPFLAWMEARARRGWFVSDLHRHALPYHAFRQWSRLAHMHRFVRHDGPVSVARAFDRRDWARFISEAGLDPAGVDVTWRLPFRLTVGRIKASP